VPPEETSSARPRRSDAEANRRRLLDVARSALDENGDASLQAIGRAAGVGQGTLYRHFPTRGALLVEVYREDFRALVQEGEQLAAAHPPDVALRQWLDALARFGRKKHALAEALNEALDSELHTEQYEQLRACIDLLLSGGVDQGVFRRDSRADDLIPLASFLWHLDTRSDPRIARLLDLVVDAFRPHADTGM
jgi:AcrR family transcriptional regulator